MKLTGIRINILAVPLVLFIVLAARPVSGDNIFAPEYLWAKKIAEKTDPIDVANTHLGIPYRDDGTLDDKGNFTTFGHPEELFETPGLNCSGLVVSVCRYLFNKNWTIEEVSRDRLGNSGANSPLGKDWNFGWNLILNLTEGRPRRLVTPDRGNYPLEKLDGLSFRGFDLDDRSAWQAVLDQMQPDRVYLGSISKPTSRRGYKILHYHVVLILPEKKGGVWLYHATHRSHVHRININTPQGLNRFMSQFTGQRAETKKILIVESAPVQIDPTIQTATDAGPNVPSGSPKLSGGLQQLMKADGAPEDSPRDSKIASDDDRVSGRLTAATETPATPDAAPRSALAPKENGPDLVINHLAGKVFRSFPDLVTNIPRFSNESKSGLKFGFRNLGNIPRDIEIQLNGPGVETRYRGEIRADGDNIDVLYPRDFGKAEAGPLRAGQYRADIRVGGTPWVVDIFEVATPREAMPKVLRVTAPSSVKAGTTFTVRVDVENKGAESDYGGITVSAPDTSGLKIVSAKPGKIYGAGSTVLAVTTDRIRTKVPMAERWIELWGENKVYDMSVQVQAGRPGTYPLYVRCALRGVNVKSSVVLMDPSSSETVDQQGFPVYVHKIRVD